jgi:hypothetical protein
MADETGIEKFSMSELARLRSELMQSGIDSWQAAEVVSTFLIDRGYGVDTFAMRNAVTRLEPFRASLEAMDTMQAVLETVAYVM